MSNYTVATPRRECVSCGHPLRSRHTTEADYPGTRVHHGRGLCGICYPRARLDRATAAADVALLDGLPPAGHRPAGDWTLDAACAGISTELFYPGPGVNPAAALAICATCPVRPECLAEAMATPTIDDHGVWGGTTQVQRRGLRSLRAQRQAAS